MKLLRVGTIAWIWVGIVSCSEDSTPTGTDGPGGRSEREIADPFTGVLTDPVVVSAQAPVLGATSVAGTADSVAYVSFSPGSFAEGNTVRIRNRGTGVERTGEMIEGGLDPLAIPAAAGDTLDVVVLDREGEVLSSMAPIVPKRRPPVIVRTVPPKKKKDVPLNIAPSIVFSEPLAASSVNDTNFRLVTGSQSVAIEVLQDQVSPYRVEIHPVAELTEDTDYQVVVGRGVRDLSGDSLESGEVIEFRTRGVVRFSEVSVGLEHACGLSTEGDLYCWGSNTRGQLGAGLIGMSSERPRLVEQPRTGRWNNVSAGPYHTCATTTTSAVYCWGSNDFGEVGVQPERCLSEAPCSSTPARVFPGGGGLGADVQVGRWWTEFGTREWQQGFNQMTIAQFSCSITEDGEVFCWGACVLANAFDNNSRCYDYKNPEDVSLLISRSDAAPVLRGNLSAGTEIVPLYFTASGGDLISLCGLTPVGMPQCTWEADFLDTLSRPDLSPDTLMMVSWGRAYGADCIIYPDQAVYCQGRNQEGILGNTSAGFSTQSMVPVPAAGRFLSLSAAPFHVCALREDGRVLCWGRVENGCHRNSIWEPLRCWDELEDPPLTELVSEVPLPGDVHITGLGAFDEQTCAVTEDGKIYCWSGGTFITDLARVPDPL